MNARRCLGWGRYAVPCRNFTTNENGCCQHHQDQAELANLLNDERIALGIPSGVRL